MKLSYSIPGKIWWITNFLDYHMYKGIHDAIIKERKKINLHSSKGIWSEHLKTLVRHNIHFQLNDIQKMSTTIHFMEKNSGINWHDDHGWKYGATFYINHKWQKQWGGEFMFTDDNGHGWIPPVGNSLVIIKSPLTHKVNPVLSPIVPRITVQIFMK